MLSLKNEIIISNTGLEYFRFKNSCTVNITYPHTVGCKHLYLNKIMLSARIIPMVKDIPAEACLLFCAGDSGGVRISSIYFKQGAVR